MAPEGLTLEQLGAEAAYRVGLMMGEALMTASEMVTLRQRIIQPMGQRCGWCVFYTGPPGATTLTRFVCGLHPEGGRVEVRATCGAFVMLRGPRADNEAWIAAMSAHERAERILLQAATYTPPDEGREGGGKRAR